ncbi:MAG: DUF4870 family protein [Sphingomonadaceae bacterium]
MEPSDPIADRPPVTSGTNRPAIVAGLYLAGFIVGITVPVGLVLAYLWKAEAGEPWERSHFSYQIRTFWIGLAWAIAGTLLTFILVGFVVLFALALWIIVRSLNSLLKASEHRPIPEPRSWLV